MSMLAAAATSNAPLAFTYNRSGGTLSAAPPQPIKQIGSVSGQDSITQENYTDTVTLSASGVEQSQQVNDSERTGGKSAGTTKSEKPAAGEEQAKTGIQKLTPAEEQVVQQLQKRDREVKAHELAHLTSAGQYARGGPTYSYQQGPDGQRYAVGGEVPIDISKERTPEQTIVKMEVVRNAAMAPAQPSSADRSIAAAAAAIEAEARQEVQSARADASQGQGKSSSVSQTTNEQPLENNSVVSAASRRTLPLDLVA